MPDNGKLIIKIDGDDSQLSNRLTGIGRVASKSLNVAIKGAAALGTAFVATAGAALKFSGDLEQNMGGSEAVFERFAGVVQDKSKSAFKTAGLSASNFLATANKMGSLFQGTGFEVEKSANMATEAIQRAADVASIMGIDINFAMESVAGMAKGNFTMMDNLGVAMNDTTLKAYAQEKGLGELATTYDKVNAAMLMFMEKTEKYAGNYEKENKTIAGAINTAKAALQNFISGTGTVEELSDALTNAAQVAVENIGKLAPKLAEGLGGLITSMIPMIPPLLKELIPAIVDTIEELFAEAIGIIPELIIAIASGVGEAIPVLSPLADIIEALANNLDVLTVAVVACTGAYIAYNTVMVAGAIIKKISTWHAATKIVMQEYTAAVIANSAATTRGITINGLLLSTMKPLEVIYGVLTGKIKLADAAQKLLNSTILKNPYAWAAALLAALVAGMVAYAATHKSASKEIMESLDDIKQSHEEAIKSIDKAQTAELAEAETAKTLKDRLFELDSQIKSGTLSKEEAKIAQENFNIAAEKLNEMIPGITSSLYNETGAIDVQYSSVNNLVDSYYELAVAKATAAAAEEKMKETAKSLLDAKVVQKTASDNHKTALENEAKRPQFDDGFLGTAGEIIYEVLIGHKSTTEVMDTYESLEKANEDVAYYEQKQKDFRLIYEETQRKLRSLSGNRTKEEEENNKRVITSTQNTAKKQTEIVKKQYEEELAALDEKLNKGQISVQQYYDELEKIRDKYCEEDSEEWHKHSEAIAEFKKEQLKDACDSGIITERQYYNELARLRDNYFEEGSEQWLKYTREIENYYNKLTNTIRGEHTPYKTVKLTMNGVEETLQILGDGKQYEGQIDKYNDLLDKFYEKIENPPEFILQELTTMGTEEGIKYLEAILGSTEEQFKAYVDRYSNDLQSADQAAQKILFGTSNLLDQQIGQLNINTSYDGDNSFESDINHINESAKDELIALKEEIEKEFGEKIPEGFFDIGKNSAIEFGKGFKSYIENLIEDVKQRINSLMSTLESATASGNGGNRGGNTYNDNRTTNITVPGSSYRAIVEAQRQNAVYQNHTNSFGGE